MQADGNAIPPLVITRHYPVPRQQVFDAWTQPQALQRWFAPVDDMRTEVPEFDLRPGGRYRIRMVESGTKAYTVTGSFSEIAPPARLVFSWAWELLPDETPLDYSRSRVIVELAAIATGTGLTLIHERLPNDDMRTEHTRGWQACLERLDRLL